jgi:SAM-dependent methyltransferase
MQPDLERRLADLMREFYDTHAEDFSATRPRLPPGVGRLLDRIPAGSRVLEVGCGDGKVGRRLAERGAHYLGLDGSAAMVNRAKRLTEKWKVESRLATFHFPLSFSVADLLDEHWPDIIARQVFDWALAFAVLHHLPGFATRARVVRALAERLPSGGMLAMSNWQLTRSERLRERIVPWSVWGLSEAAVEPNDFLLTWERGERRGLRYVHVLAEAEAHQLAGEAGLTVTEVFSADGAGGNLAEYVVMRRS